MSPLNSYSETLIPKGIVSGDGAFGRRSGVGGVMRAGLASLQEGEGTQDSLLSPVM